jgi:hypothetical protein
MMMEAVRTSETSVDNYFTRQYIPEDNSELQSILSIHEKRTDTKQTAWLQTHATPKFRQTPP